MFFIFIVILVYFYFYLKINKVINFRIKCDTYVCVIVVLCDICVLTFRWRCVMWLLSVRWRCVMVPSINWQVANLWLGWLLNKVVDITNKEVEYGEWPTRGFGKNQMYSKMNSSSDCSDVLFSSSSLKYVRNLLLWQWKWRWFKITQPLPCKLFAGASYKLINCAISRDQGKLGPRLGWHAYTFFREDFPELRTLYLLGGRKHPVHAKTV